MCKEMVSMSKNGRNTDMAKVEEEESTELERYTLALPPDISAKVRQIARENNTSVQTTLRQLVRMGVLVLEADKVTMEKDGETFRVFPLYG
jgi:hypothetical protein